MNKETITVNGVVYDAVTGMPITKQESAPAAATRQRAGGARPSHLIHQRTAPARTVNRHAPMQSAPAVLKRAEATRPAKPSALRSPAVTRFAPQPSRATNRPRVMSDITPATPHPIAKKASERLVQSHAQRAEAPAFKPSSVLKKEAISEALEKAPNHHPAQAIKRARRAPRIASFASAALALLLLAGYLTYINLPNLSVRVAANQAGIDANYPGYRPDGYRLAGVNYDKGSVSLKFAANAGPQNFTITQQQTNWDSTAVKENYVKANWGDNVVPYSERGLTIYSHNGNAAWVNGGILYTITGDAPLSASQVRGIAVSL